MCSLCGKCKTNGLTPGDCAVVPKFRFENGQLVKTTKTEQITNKVLTRTAIFARVYLSLGGKR